ncbi:HTH-type transcriptional regulator PgrR [Thalassocella blandensis]|nr:HTH-type transcriptional regulator PgrR [Thalassocella blandensis]
MTIDLNSLSDFIAVAEAGGFREAARKTNSSASRLSDSVRRLETHLGLRLFNRNTRSVVPTEAGINLLQRMNPLMNELNTALDGVNIYRNKPAGKLRLNVPVSASKLILSAIVPAFLREYPDIQIEVVAQSQMINIVDAGFDAGIRYDEGLDQDVIAIPIGPRKQRLATAAAPALLEKHGHPKHPRELLDLPCIAGRFESGILAQWEFEKGNKVIKITPNGPLIVSIGAGVDLAVNAAKAGTGIIHLFEQWLDPYFTTGELVPVLKPWWQTFNGPYLYYSGRRFVPEPLRVFIEYIKNLY